MEIHKDFEEARKNAFLSHRAAKKSNEWIPRLR